MLSGKQGMPMFVVFTKPADRAPFKAFSNREGARQYAKAEADGGADSSAIYETPGIDDARKAVAAVQASEAVFVEAFGARASQDQINEAKTREIFREFGIED